MINRVLIRIKVVQMLYSYLLTQGEFKLREIPENATRDKKFAHSTYIDLLLMVLRLSGVRLNPESKVIAGVDDNRYLPLNKVVKSLRSDDAIRRVAMKSDPKSSGSAVIARETAIVAPENSITVILLSSRLSRVSCT